MDKPVVEGAYSVDCDRKYVNNWQNLKYLKIPKQINFNLNEGDYTDKPPYNQTERMDQLTSFVMHHHKELINDEKRVDADFLCFRGVLRIIMATPYKRKKPWALHAIKFKGTIYMCMCSDQANSVKVTTKVEQYGFKFESYVLSNDLLTKPPGSTSTVIEAEEFCVVMSSRINKKFKILFGSEIDGVDSTEVVKDIDQLETSPLVEVKLKKREVYEKQKENFLKYKAIDWWCQSFVANVTHIHCGIRNDEGIVDEVKSYNIEDLAKEAEHNKFWFTSICKKFLSDFLEKVTNEMRLIDDPQLTFRYTWNPRNQINLEKCYGKTFFKTDYIDFILNL